MRYSKLFITSLLLFACSNICYAENWEEAFNGNKEIYIDTDSVNYHNDSLYYSVKYFDNNLRADVVAIIQNKEGNAGVVSTCKLYEYQQNFINALTPKIAPELKPLNTNSLLFNANARAIEINNKNQQKSQSINKADNVDFRPYMRRLQRRIKRNWEPPKGSETKKVVVLFKIGKDGRLISSEIFKTSGDEAADKAALLAIAISAPYEPLPKAYTEESIDIQFAFDYNIIGSSR